MTPPNPYIGITGITTRQEVEAVLDAYAEAGYSLETSHIPMLGYLVSYKSLSRPQWQPPSRRYPRFIDLRCLLEMGQGRALQVIHYSSKQSNLAAQVTHMLDGLYETGLCRAIQFNIPWPEVVEVREIKNRFPDVRLIWQLSQPSVQRPGGAVAVADRVRDYGGAVSDVLIDPSAGRGQAFGLADSPELGVYQAFRALTGLGLGFAGGFDDENVAVRVQEIIDLTGQADFSIDVESRVRNRLSAREGDDVLALDKVQAYVRAAATVLP